MCKHIYIYKGNTYPSAFSESLAKLETSEQAIIHIYIYIHMNVTHALHVGSHRYIQVSSLAVRSFLEPNV